METENITSKIKHWVVLGLAIPVISGAAIGYGAFKHNHSVTEIHIEGAKVTGTLISVRTLVDGKINEFLFNDGEEVAAGDVIARLEVEVNEETIAQLENTVELAKENLETLKLGQTVKVPVKRVRAIPAAPTTSAPQKNSTLASLEERANRMKELFEMGAVSKKDMEAAVAAYENARAAGTPAPASSGTTYVEEIEYVDQWQPTPAAVIQNAENAIKQAELSLNVALQEAQETEVVSPVSGTIYYIAESDKELIAGNSIARIGDSNELWLEAEVPEDIFNRITLGMPVDYVLEGRNLAGTVIEKVEPNINQEVSEEENSSAWIPPTDENEHPEYIPKTNENADERPNDKYILKFSIPTERDFECKPNSSAEVKIKLY